jgi:superfamily II DNA or RNA helicase
MIYKIYKNEYKLDELSKIRNDLTLSLENKFQKTYSKVKVYIETTDKIYIPYQYGINELGTRQAFKFKDKSDSIEVKFEGELRSNQKDIIKKAEDELYSKKHATGCIIALATGQGKTILGLNLISRLKKKTLIIVNKEFLMNQWIERIGTFLPNAKIGCIQRNKLDIEGKDIVIGMLQSIVSKDYPREIYESFGCVIADECHHMSAETFSKSFFKIGVKKYNIGLSATPQRKDGLTPIIEWHIGRILDNPQDSSIKSECNIRFYNIKYEREPEEILNAVGRINLPSMITELISNEKRNNLIVEHTIELIEQPGRKILILSDRISHLKNLYNLINLKTEKTVGLYIGKMKDNELKLSNKCDIILGSFNMCAEGYDCPDLNTLILSTPKSEITQAIGRIFRKEHEIPKIIIDYCDNFSMFKVQGYKRKRIYKNILTEAKVYNKDYNIQEDEEFNEYEDEEFNDEEFNEDE